MDPEFPGLASPAMTLPASFYLASRPSWFGSVIWPPTGPDVACTTGCIANTADHAGPIEIGSGTLLKRTRSTALFVWNTIYNRFNFHFHRGRDAHIAGFMCYREY